MSIDRDHAATALRDIAVTEQRTFEATVYARSSSILMFWGVLTACGYVFEYFQPRHAELAWRVLVGAGYVVMATMSGQRGRGRLGRKIFYAQLALVVFGLLIVIVLGPFNGRRLDAFWPLLFMFGYVLAGIWVGRFFIICGCAVSALTIVGYFWSGPWFPLWMAAVNGGALLLGGVWLRRAGARV